MSDDDADRDVMLSLRAWHARCQRHGQHPFTTAQTGDVLLRTINELWQLRRTVEQLRAERQLLEQMIKGSPKRLHW